MRPEDQDPRNLSPHAVPPYLSRFQSESNSAWRYPESGMNMGYYPNDNSANQKYIPFLNNYPMQEMRTTNPITNSKIVLIGVVLASLLAGVLGGIGSSYITRTGVIDSANTTLHFDTSPASDNDSTVTKVVKLVLNSVVKIEVRSGNAIETGSGAVIDESGHIITNNHVVAIAAIDPQAILKVVFSDGTVLPGRIVGRDPKTDLAVVKVKVNNLTTITLGDSDKLKVGQGVIAIGSPLRLDSTVTAGIVSSLHRAIIIPENGPGLADVVFDAIQTDAAINPGNSGGPLVDMSGRLVGINTANYGNSSGVSAGLGFAIPINDAFAVVQQIIKTGKVKHGEIGIIGSDVTGVDFTGVKVRDVLLGGPAEQAGLQVGDIIIKVERHNTLDLAQLIVAVRQSAAKNKTLTVVYIRGGKTFTANVTPRFK